MLYFCATWYCVGESNENCKFFKLNLLNESGPQLYHFCTVFISFSTGPPAFTKCLDSSRKKILVFVCVTTHALPAVPLHQNWTSFLPSPLWVTQTYGSHLGQGLVSLADVEVTQVQVFDCCNCCMAVWGQELSCCKRTPLAKSRCHFDLSAGRRRFSKRSECETLVIVFLRGV
jgi:hypothetical protein